MSDSENDPLTESLNESGNRATPEPTAELMPDPPSDGLAPRPGRRKRLRMFLWSAAGMATLIVCGIGILVVWMSTAGFEVWVRARLVDRIAEATGGRVEIRDFHWHPLDLEAEADGVVIHGLEGAGEAPYAQVEHIRTRLSILDIWSPRVLLRELEVTRPRFHLIVYADGSTNQPKPQRPKKNQESGLDTVFDLEAGRIAVEQGVLLYQDKSADFDFQDRKIPLDFSARDASLHMSYASATKGNPESYHIEAGIRDLAIARGALPRKTPPAQGYIQATLDLTRNSLFVRSLRITSRSRPAKEGTGEKAKENSKEGAREHALEVSGAIEDFSHPRWQARVTGELDMTLLDPVTGFPDTPEGLARLDLTASGREGQFRADGGLHVEGASYIANGVTAVDVGVDAHVHADAQQLLITQAVARFAHGGRIEGTISLAPWISPLPGSPSIGNGIQNSVRAVAGSVPPSAFKKPEIDVPVNGKVTANLKDLPLDTLLDMVSQPPLMRVGFNTLLTGPAKATWSKGDTDTLVIGAALDLRPGDKPEAGEVAATGTLDASYAEHQGNVDLRRLELHTPGGELDAHGNLGVYPITGPTSLAVDLHSQDLRDFDIFLRNLGLRREGKTGVAALPVKLDGIAEFRGTWTGSLVDPHLAGSAQAAQISIETAPPPGDETGQPQWVHWDAIEATGSYAAERIDVAHGDLRRGGTEITLQGDLTAAPDSAVVLKHTGVPEFDDSSALHLRLRANRMPADQLEPLTGSKLPITGSIDTQVALDGLMGSLNGTGWAELTDGSVYGQQVERIRGQGTLTGPVFNLSSLAVSAAGGSMQGKGEYNFDTKQFKLDSHGSGIDVAKIAALGGHGVEPAGALEFTLAGAGTLDDPRLNGDGKIDKLAVNGQSLGTLSLHARSANRSLTYEASTRMDAASVTLHGQTALKGDYATKAELGFSEFNIGALLAMADLQSLSGESALAGTVALEGPLARPDDLHGELRIAELAVTVAGVHLKSDNGLHATLANARVSLDPLHITGEQTDLSAQGALALRGERRLDFAARGSINLKLGEMLDPDLTASGTTTFQVEGHGPLKDPGLRGTIEFQNGSLALEDVPNGLSQLHGTLEFNSDRLEVKSLTAMSGGGQLSVGGYLAYQHGLYADLKVTGKGIRVRYPPGVSSLADGDFRLQGMRNNLVLSGNVLITRFSVSPDLDIAALAAQANAVQPVVSPDAPSNHIRLDVRVVSSPQLNFQNTVAKLAGNVDLRLRGTVASPTLLGSVQITEGNALIAGTRYELQRGTISFTNPVRIEPSIDLSATAHVSDYDITLGLHGTPSKMSMSYRSDPPLPEADVLALLALGRSGDQQRLYTAQQEQQGNSPATDALLGGALNATVSSRVQKLFGAGSVKIDPNYIGALGNSTSRIIVEEQVGRDLTLTYATNVDTTQQQLLQAEIAINRHVSLLVARDESGVFSMVIKATRRFR